MDEFEISPSKKDQPNDPETSQTPSKNEEAKAAGAGTDEKTAETVGSDSPARCPICLATPQNDAKSDSCSHNFCFSCLKEWCKVKAECPLCKMPIHSIFYNIKSDAEYDEYKVKMPQAELKYSMYSIPSDLSFNWWQSTFRREFYRRRRASEMVIEAAASSTASIRKRRTYYWNKSKVTHVDTRNRVRECSAQFFRDNPSQIHRLVPWLRRELTALYGATNKTLIDHIFKKITDVLPYIDIDSRAFRNRMHEYMLEYTDHFIHEFLSFARSPYNVSQYDRCAHYSSNNDCQSGSSRNTSHPRKHQYRDGGHSRWDHSPDSTPLGASAQSMMLSQTPWSEDTTPSSILDRMRTDRIPDSLDGDRRATNSIRDAVYSGGLGLRFGLNPAMPFSGYYGPLSHPWIFPRDRHRDVAAPLQLQTMDLFRPGGSSARQYQSMERIRQHIGEFQRNSSNRRRREARESLRTEEPSITTVPIIVISDSSEEETSADVNSASNTSKTIHYKPVTNRSEISESERPPGTEEEIRVKVEVSHCRNASSSSSAGSSDSDSDSSSSGIEFVRYIKPPHLRTPDAFINLSSTDDDTPGPSSKVTAVIKPLHSATQNGSPPALRQRDSRMASNDILERTREFLENARQSVRTARSDDGVSDILLSSVLQSTSNPGVIVSEAVQDRMLENIERDSMISQNLTVVGEDIIDQLHQADSGPSSQRNATPKKIFQKGKVSISFPASKRLYSSSDSEVDVDYIEEVPIASNREPYQDDLWTSDLYDDVDHQDKALKSVITIPENRTSPTSNDNPDSRRHRTGSSSDRNVSDKFDRAKRKNRKRKHSRHSDSSHSVKSTQSRRSKKHKRHRHRSSSVEFVKDLR